MNACFPRMRAATAYQNAARAEHPARQIALLYDIAIRRLHEARSAITEQRIEDRCRFVLKAFEILQALQSCLDFEHGGTIAPMLCRYYGSAMNRLLQINQKNDPALCDEIIAYLTPMRESWARIADGAAAGPPAGSTRPDEAAPASFTA